MWEIKINWDICPHIISRWNDIDYIGCGLISPFKKEHEIICNKKNCPIKV